jgi:hypothetical protein
MARCTATWRWTARRARADAHSTLAGDANLLVLPNIDAANISYNLLKTAAGGNIAIGPVLLGAAKPVHILTASTTVRRIVNMTALTVADANAIRQPRAPAAARAAGYYREYTVRRRGSRDRGARRIVCGGERPVAPEACFYTADHYASFKAHRAVLNGGSPMNRSFLLKPGGRDHALADRPSQHRAGDPRLPCRT